MACLDRIDPSAHHNDWNRLGRILSRQDRSVSCYHDDINLEMHQLSRKRREPIELSPPHIGTRWRCSVLLCGNDPAERDELLRNGRSHELHRPTIDTLSGGLSSPAGPRLGSQERRASRLEQGYRVSAFSFLTHTSRTAVLVLCLNLAEHNTFHCRRKSKRPRNGWAFLSMTTRSHQPASTQVDRGYLAVQAMTTHKRYQKWMEQSARYQN